MKKFSIKLSDYFSWYIGKNINEFSKEMLEENALDFLPEFIGKELGEVAQLFNENKETQMIVGERKLPNGNWVHLINLKGYLFMLDSVEKYPR